MRQTLCVHLLAVAGVVGGGLKEHKFKIDMPWNVIRNVGSILQIENSSLLRIALTKHILCHVAANYLRIRTMTGGCNWVRISHLSNRLLGSNGTPSAVVGPCCCFPSPSAVADVDEEAERRPTVSLVPSASAAPAAAAVEAILGAVVIPGVPGQREMRYCSSAAAAKCNKVR